MGKKKNGKSTSPASSRLELKKEVLRNLDTASLDQVNGGLFCAAPTTCQLTIRPPR